MKKILMVIVLVLLTMLQIANGQTSLNIYMKNGQSYQFQLLEIDSITF